MKHAQNQKGFTLIEIAIVLAIIAVLAVMGNSGIGIYKQVKNEKESQALKNVASALQTKFRNDSVTTGLNSLVVNNAGVLAKTGWTSSGGAAPVITHGLKGIVSFAPANVVPGAGDDGISISMASVPFDSCGDIARSASQRAEIITIGTTVVQTTSATPATGISIDAACGNTGVVTMTFVYTKNP